MVGRRIGDEYVLVPLAGRGADLDSILNLNRVAAFVWERLDGARSGAEVVDAVVEQFEVDRARAEHDYLELVETLVEARRRRRAPRSGRDACARARASDARAPRGRARLPAAAARPTRGATAPSPARSAARVRPGASVLDLGAGSGVWAVLAARLGARRVVAVEREAVLVPVIEALAREAGVAERVEVRARGRAPGAAAPRVRRRGRRARGQRGLRGGPACAVFERARERFLRRGGALVPEAAGARGRAGARAGAHSASRRRSCPRAASRRSRPTRPRNLHPVRAPRRSRRAASSCAIDLRTARARDRLPVGARALPGDGRPPPSAASRVWVRIGLAPGVVARDAPRHALAADALADRAAAAGARSPRGRGRLEPARADAGRWRFEGRARRPRRGSYSPLFAWGIVRAALARR